MSEQAGRAIVYERSQRRCEVCNWRRAESVHHRVKKGQGGSWSPANLIDVCGHGTVGCHQWIEAHPDHARALGLWVPSTTDPATVPVYVQPVMLWREWWWADEHGMWTWDATRSMHEHPPGYVTAAIRSLTDARLM